MEKGDFYLGSRKYNLKNVKVNLEGNWRDDVIKYPNSRYWFKVGDMDCLIKRADDFRYYGTIILNSTSRDYRINFNLSPELRFEIFRFLHFNNPELEFDWYYVTDLYSQDYRFVTFGFMEKYATRGQNHKYYSFEKSKELLSALARFFNSRNKYQLDIGAPNVLVNGLVYDKLNSQ